MQHLVSGLAQKEGLSIMHVSPFYCQGPPDSVSNKNTIMVRFNGCTGLELS